MKHKYTGIACSIFRNEIDALGKLNRLDIPFLFIDSMLHIYPEKLNSLLDDMIKNELLKGKKVILIYGDCSPHMKDFESRDSVERVRGMNCCEILMGMEHYRHLRKKGVFFLMAEWISRWDEIFQYHLGLKENICKMFMKDMHSGLIYLDTGFNKVPEDMIYSLKDYTGLPFNVLQVKPDNLLNEIHAAIERLNRD